MRYVDKQFLSGCYGESGSMVVQFSSPTLEDYKESTYWSAIDGDISISDCSKTICLDFTFKDEATMRKRIAKLDKMIEMLQNARNVLPQLLAEKDKVAEEFKKQEEKEKKNE